MKFKFEELQYQQNAIDSVVKIFRGQEPKQSNFTVLSSTRQIGIAENITEDGNSIGIGNKLELDTEDILKNLNDVQLHNQLEQTNNLDKDYYEFDIEMETGTGKTYVYLKTIFELNKNYGFSKFIIIVPSVPIKEGVKKALDITQEKLKKDYANIPYNYFVYDSSKPNQVRDFATSSNIEIMIITIAAFNKDKNIINQGGTLQERGKLLDLIKATKPILIIDEPQLVDKTDKAQESITSLNPIVSLRYSATHARKSNLVYRFNSIDAYEGGFVKQIEVADFASVDYHNRAYMELVSVSNKNSVIKAKIKIDVLSDNGVIQRKVVEVDKNKNNNLYDLSGKRDVYENYLIRDIYCEPGNEYIEFVSHPEILEKGKPLNDIDGSQFERQQIIKTIEEHLDKELKLNKQGIKVLSLFFIDTVAKYRSYDENGLPIKGEYAKVFEEEYSRIVKRPKYRTLFNDIDVDIDVEKVHNGYFSIDKKVVSPFDELKDAKTKIGAEESTYNLIMRDKERLLSLDNPLRFIFSHSALGVGWDNPNVFQICTLADNKSETDRRQKIGRGLRLCVKNENGKFERVQGFETNVLTVMANESYEKFAEELQKEIEKEEGIKFEVIESHSFAHILTTKPDGTEEPLGQAASQKIFEFYQEKGYIDNKGKVKNELKIALKDDTLEVPEEFKQYKEAIESISRKSSIKLDIKKNSDKKQIQLNKQVYLSPEFKELWDRIKYKTTYHVDFDSSTLINKCSEVLKSLSTKQSLIVARKAKMSKNKAGIDMKQVDYYIADTINDEFELPDIISYLQNKTNLTRKTLVEILCKSETLDLFKKNPQAYMSEAATLISREMRTMILDGIKYTKIGDDNFYAQELFDEKELYGYLSKNMIESKKSVYDHIVYDSTNEESFAERFENNNRIKLYVKLPNWFKISTPLGPYNPDWAILIDKNGEDKLYFVIETKAGQAGLLFDEALRDSEKAKIKCGHKHFEALGNEVEFKEANNFERLIEDCMV